ncbi:hypothetical protein ACVOZ6_003435 [Escherichia coli]
MTYWPVAVIVVLGVIWVLATMLKHSPGVLAKCGVGSYACAALVGIKLIGNEGAGPVLAVTFVLGTILLVVSCVFCMFYEAAR